MALSGAALASFQGSLLSQDRAEACRDSLTALARARGLSGPIVDSALAAFRPDTTVLTARLRQPEFVTPIWEYLGFLVDEERIADGRQALATWAAVLDRVERETGVDRHTVVAVWGIESDYGRLLGQRPLLNSLGTQTCFGGRRAFARDQLVATLRILVAGDLAPSQLLGSWAGAFGQTQFMPTTFLSTAVDFDGDGRRDIVGSVPDALGSTANYLVRAGWKSGETWGYEVTVPARYRGPSGRTNRRPLATWSAAGVRPVLGGPSAGEGQAALLRPAGPTGPAFLALSNFQAIYSYNAAESYALAIGHLADRLRGSDPLVTSWPGGVRGLSRVERRELQSLLVELGHGAGAADGILGARTRDALRRFQRSVGLPADGRATGAVLDSLRAAAARR
ncbi:MAG: lytic murein transglycosylase [Gemmatimonadetes bacterium]|nr:lytic murein transglycosylase [Gemmatimonadota bacterium]